MPACFLRLASWAHTSGRYRKGDGKTGHFARAWSKNSSNVQHRVQSKSLGRHSLIQRSPGYVTADQNTSWHTTLSTPNGAIISHLPELGQNHAVAPEPSIRLSTLSAKMRKHSIAASW